MLSIQAHTFRKQARLAITLAWVAGYTNTVSVLTIGTVTSHVSGTASALGRDTVQGNWPAAAHALVLFLSFFLGAVVSAIMTETARRRGWRSMYVLPIGTEVALLLVFAAGLQYYGHQPPETLTGLYWLGGVAAAAMGLQNATITRISGGVVRTTHMTGVLTDVGLESVRLVWRWWDNRAPGTWWAALRDPLGKRVLLLGSIGASFTLGAAIGTAVFMFEPGATMYAPAAFLLWIIWLEVTRPIANIEELDAANLEAAVSAGAGSYTIAPGARVYRLTPVADREKKRHRAPNFQLWAENVPEGTRAVILDVSAARRNGAGALTLDANAMADLREAMRRLTSQSGRLVLAGAGPEHFGVLRDAGVFDFADPMDVCTDMDFALARAHVLMDDEDARRRATALP
jgi:uncharacterized membrane protein YoaK (UPF0700 family)